MKPLSEYEQKIDKLHDGCPIKAAIDVIRGRWKPMILWELNCGTKRFFGFAGSAAGNRGAGAHRPVASVGSGRRYHPNSISGDSGAGRVRVDRAW